MEFRTKLQKHIHKSVNGNVAVDTHNSRHWVGAAIRILGRIRSYTEWTKHYRGRTQYMCTIGIQLENHPDEWLSVFTGEETEFAHFAKANKGKLATFRGKYKKVQEYPKGSGKWQTVVNWVKGEVKEEPSNQEDWEDEGRKHEARMAGVGY